MEFKNAISNLESISKALDTYANNYDGDDAHWIYHLEQMSWMLQKQANELKDIEYLFGMTQDCNTLNLHQNNSETE